MPLKINTKFKTIAGLFTAMTVTISTAIATPYQPTNMNDNKHIRVATFNVSMEALNYLERGQTPSGKELEVALKSQHQQIKNIAEIIQTVRPDLLMLNEFDYIENLDDGIGYFIKNYLNVAQTSEVKAIDYPYVYLAPSNTGVATPYDLDNSGQATGTKGDAYGFGFFPGHFAMVFLSQHPIDFDKVKTFQHFKWKDMPNALQTVHPETNKPWYSKEAWNDLRLSSKSHWDIPVTVNGKTIHVLAMHPTPPVFDGKEDRNGKRNHDELRLFNDYITPNKGSYIYDDNGKLGQLAEQTRFVIVGDLNASEVEGDAVVAGISSLLANPAVNSSYIPTSKGGQESKSKSKHRKTHTAYWGMRADYVLPSSYGFSILNGGVFWPEKTSTLFRLVETREASSDHRLVYLDLEITD